MSIKMPQPISDDRQAAACIAAASPPKIISQRVVVNLRMQPHLLARIDAEARRLGITRTAWLHIAANRALG
jgi:hypothetical protein